MNTIKVGPRFEKPNLNTKAAKRNQPSFGMKPPKLSDYLVQKKTINVLNKLKWFDGEEGRILITAIGTGAIAPLFIAWNPYVKPKKDATDSEKAELKRTQKYTAMRQPISAALAIPIQLSLVKPINRGLDKIFNNPEFSKYLPTYLNKSALQDDKYIELQEKKKLKGLKLSKAEYKKQLQANINATTNKQIDKVAKHLLANGEIRIKEGVDGLADNASVIESLKKEIKNYMSYTNKLLYDSYDDKDLNKLLTNASENITTGNKGKAFYVDRANTLITNRKELEKVLGTDLPKDQSKIASYLTEKYNNASDPKLKDIYKEIIDLPKSESQASRCSRTIERIKRINEICNGHFTPGKYLDYMQQEEAVILGRIREFARIANGVQENPDSIKNAINQVAENCKFDKNDRQLNKIFHGIENFGDNVDELKKNISKRVVKAYKSMTKDRYRFIKEVAGISLGLFVTVPLTCHVLNWVYPRFMEIFFPKLIAPKKEQSTQQNGGEK